MKTVLILGANGRFGQAATQAFAAAGWHVLAQVRRAPVAPLPAKACALPVALNDTDTLVARATGLQAGVQAGLQAGLQASVQAVVHAVNPVYTRWEEEAMPALQQGLAVAQRLGALFMLPGNVYNFGSQMPALLTEATPQRPDNDKGRLRVAMEALMQARAPQGLRSVVIRAGDFYGCGSGSWLDQAVVKDIRRGKLVYPGPLDLPHAWAYLPDLARAFVAVANLPPKPGFEALHFEGHTLTGRELLAIVTAAAADLGLQPAAGFKTGGMPWGLVRAVGLVHPPWRELARMSYLWRVPHALDGTALRQAAGPLHHTPAHLALRQALADLGLGGAPATAAAAAH